MKERVYKIVSQVMHVPVSEINEDSSPDTFKGWNSLMHMNLILALEEEFGVQFDDQQTIEMMNVGLIVAVLTDVLRDGLKQD